MESLNYRKPPVKLPMSISPSKKSHSTKYFKTFETQPTVSTNSECTQNLETHKSLDINLLPVNFYFPKSKSKKNNKATEIEPQKAITTKKSKVSKYNIRIPNASRENQLFKPTETKGKLSEKAHKKRFELTLKPEKPIYNTYSSHNTSSQHQIRMKGKRQEEKVTESTKQVFRITRKSRAERLWTWKGAYGVINNAL